MITAEALIKILLTVPKETPCYGYEGEDIGIGIGDIGFITASESNGEKEGKMAFYNTKKPQKPVERTDNEIAVFQ